jgi:hypothetical protein
MTLTFSDHVRKLPKGRQAMMRRLRSHIRQHLPSGYVERFDQRMLMYEIPLKMYASTYNRRPLMLAALASHSSVVTLYLMAVYGDKALEKWFREAYAASGKTLKMGKSCVHFRALDDIPFEVIDRAIAKVPVRRYIEIYERARKGTRSGK